jgi:serine/threonine protein kinase
MKSLLASIRDGGGLDRVDHAVQLLEDEWRRHGDVPLEPLWREQKRLIASAGDESIVLLSELIKTDLRCRFARGQTPAVADYLSRFPELNEADSRVLSLIYEEFCLVEERGGRVDVTAFCDRYPRWKESLVSQLQYHHLFSQAAGARPKTPPFPEAGGTFEEFQLVSLLGRGGTSRVFLARDLSLGGKQVVLKVSLDRGREPQAQGALDHPHIVPVNSVVFGDEGMRGLSMPYRPGSPLDEVIRRVAPASKPPRAMDLWEALVRAPDPTADPSPKAEVSPPPDVHAAGPRGDGWEGFPARGTYSQGVAWVVKVIAEALHYAHGQRTFHRDVKPANVLLTVHHGPQLLDFNLAESPHSASQAQAAMHGGTLPYMAPEQIEAFLDPELWGKVGARADIYSLGLVLRELLTGQAPDLPAETLAPARAMRVLLDRRPLLDVTVRRANPAIPHALEAIVAKCLAVSPDDRYPDAGALTEDLDRFLQHRPLAHAANPSALERCTDWGVRNRLRLAVVAACLVPLPFVLPTMVGRSPKMSRSPIATKVRPSIRVESSPDMRDALDFLNQGKLQASIDRLSWLVEQYPASRLPRMYLALAYHTRPEDLLRSEKCFRESLDISGDRTDWAAWVSTDDRLWERLDEFALRRFEMAREIRRDKKYPEPQLRQETTEQYRLARAALELSHEIRPDSEEITFHLANAEVNLEEFVESARQRANQEIELLNARAGRELDYGVKVKLHRRIYDWTALRCLSLTKLAKGLRRAESRTAREKALEHLRLAESDLQGCITFVTSHTETDIPLCDVEELRFDLLMTRVEVKLDLGDRDAAKNDLSGARAAVQNFDRASRRVYGRKPDARPLYDRLHEIDHRFRQVEARNAGLDRDRGEQMTANGPPRAR